MTPTLTWMPALAPSALEEFGVAAPQEGRGKVPH
jgi:hypothetical protein